ncbi:hypothetical protein [Spirosoma jeollabukense]
MADLQLLSESFIQFFAQHLPQLDSTYNWPVGAKAREGLSTFKWHPKSGNLEECIALKHYLTESWSKADAEEKAKLAKWIVADWGGVRGNHSVTLQAHLNQIENDARPLKGVASYSKILSVVNCTQYAIYDARVAVSLNAVQMTIGSTKPVFFQYVPSQNKTIQAFAKAYPIQELVGNRKWDKVARDATYTTYLELLHKLKSHFTDTEIYHLEMTLFSLAPDFCKQLLNK